jgi:hypothetical protein
MEVVVNCIPWLLYASYPLNRRRIATLDVSEKR